MTGQDTRVFSLSLCTFAWHAYRAYAATIQFWRFDHIWWAVV